MRASSGVWAGTELKPSISVPLGVLQSQHDPMLIETNRPDAHDSLQMPGIQERGQCGDKVRMGGVEVAEERCLATPEGIDLHIDELSQMHEGGDPRLFERHRSGTQPQQARVLVVEVRMAGHAHPSQDALTYWQGSGVGDLDHHRSTIATALYLFVGRRYPISPLSPLPPLPEVRLT